MGEFLSYFLSHMPTSDQWAAFLFVSLFAYVAARNTVLRREHRVNSAYIRILEAERRLHLESLDELEQLNKEYWAMIQKQAGQIDILTTQLKSAQTQHLN